jgi:hypothetical protein
MSVRLAFPTTLLEMQRMFPDGSSPATAGEDPPETPGLAAFAV